MILFDIDAVTIIINIATNMPLIILMAIYILKKIFPKTKENSKLMRLVGPAIDFLVTKHKETSICIYSQRAKLTVNMRCTCISPEVQLAHPHGNTCVVSSIL